MEQRQILSSLRKDALHSDLTVICGDRKFQVHKCIVCLRSKWFRSACDKQRWKEGTDNVIELKAVEEGVDIYEEDFSCDLPEAVQLMIDFMYLDDYEHLKTDSSEAASEQEESEISSTAEEMPREASEEIIGVEVPNLDTHPPEDWMDRRHEPEDWMDAEYALEAEHQASAAHRSLQTESAVVQDPLTIHARLYALGAKYHVKGLRRHALQKFREQVQHGQWERAHLATAVIVAFGAAAEQDRRLKDFITDTILNSSPGLATDSVIEEAIKSVDGLPYELFKQQSLRRIPLGNKHGNKAKRFAWA